MTAGSWTGFYYDGQTADRESVNVIFESDGLRLERPDGSSIRWQIADVRQTQGGFSGEQVRLEYGAEPAQVLLVNQPGFAAEAARRFPSTRKAWKRRSATGRLLALGAAGFALVAALYVWGAPVLATSLAPVVPVSWEHALASGVEERMAPASRQCTDSATLATLRGILDTLIRSQPAGSIPYEFRMVVLQDTLVNAFAAPGGFIAVNSGLLRAARNAEEFAGVLAHEVSHVTKRHTTRSIIREMPLRLAVAAIAGGSAAEGAAQVAGTLGALRYRRGDETEADVEGMKLIQAARIDPRGTVEIMRTLEAKGASVPRFASYLSSHPQTADRVAELERLAAQATYTPRPLLAEGQWQVVQSGCR